jgi:hypothetical protein
MIGQRPGTVATAIDAIADTARFGTLSVRLAPVGLIAQRLPLLPEQQLGHLHDVSRPLPEW